MSRIFIWGAGRCGRSIANALTAAGHDILGTWNRSQAAAERGGPKPWPTYFGPERPAALDQAEVVWITVTDTQLAAQGHVLRSHQIALHASGAVPSRILKQPTDAARAVASCHPIQSFSEDIAPPEHIRGITFGLEGDPEAVQIAKDLVESMDASWFVVESDTQKALYHAACCIASNALVALADQAVDVFQHVGVDRPTALRALAPLILGTARNLSQANTAQETLTGPIARGDHTVIAAHKNAIAQHCPDFSIEYDRLCDLIERMLAQ